MIGRFKVSECQHVNVEIKSDNGYTQKGWCLDCRRIVYRAIK